MHKLILELIRLYLAPATVPGSLAPRIAGETADLIDLAGPDGTVRAILIPFQQQRTGDEAAHWTSLCTVANALQADLDLPAPAVSVSGLDGYGLWLSLANPVAPALAQEFVDLLRLAYFPDVKMAAASTLVALPPCRHPVSGKWAAFIHPGMGASFADESGLEMAPPLGGQVGFLEGLQSIDAARFADVLATLRRQYPNAAVPAAAPGPAGLLLKDATLEDIVAHLHAKNIEPTFCHRLR